MKKLLPILLYLISVSLYSQECKYVRNEVDEFTKNEIKKTQLQTVFNSVSGGQLNLSLNKIDSVRYLSINFKLKNSGKTSLCFNDGSKLLFKLGNDSIIEANYVGEIECAEYDVKVSQYGTSYDCEISGNFMLSRDLMDEYLSKYLLKKIRIYFSDGYMDYEISDSVKWPAFSYSPKGDKAVNPQFYFIRFLKCIN